MLICNLIIVQKSLFYDFSLKQRYVNIIFNRKVLNFDFLRRDNVSFPPFEYNPWWSGAWNKQSSLQKSPAQQITA